ncbi:hypothetical protein SAMN05216439_0976 [Methanobrevibacter gottschalkii]|uniref:Uncharacterized protein n=2 Tax=Methanobrevibacter gottschalkii TaxID=190974 RepID=A0A3N5B0U3_9EURY|nr:MULTISPECIES: hypothetical protein [Methanobrevibacter]MCQ2970923.1 hypothetical protein [archaeon]OED00645.1 hypothetical protein A9505_02975 [Methanobrevibacter sp. A27]RPF50843.1 hypothetical protein EDC42_1500 [Methanobrevibacter gottschalkii DSM 11977]SEK45507.1 hypothetical protein SAMN05216439_0976 [Methanobrevibacter gottschalkii]
MKGSVKAKLIVFMVIALLAFGISSAFASLIISDSPDSYKLIPIKNDSFEPNYINKVPTILPKVETNNTTNITTNKTNYNMTNLNYTNQWVETYEN